MISFDTIHEMDAETLDLVAAYRPQRRRPSPIEIARYCIQIERPHSEVGMIAVDNQRSPGASDAEGGGQAMRLA